MTREMTPAEFKITRLYLGYPLQELADYLGEEYSAARNWDNGRCYPPAEVADRVRELARLTEQVVAYLTRHYETHTDEWPIEVPYNQESVDAGIYEDVEAPEGAPVGWWRMVLARVAHNIPDAGVDWT